VRPPSRPLLPLTLILLDVMEAKPADVPWRLGFTTFPWSVLYNPKPLHTVAAHPSFSDYVNRLHARRLVRTRLDPEASRSKRCLGSRASASMSTMLFLKS
jgi:hypothetical protein